MSQATDRPFAVSVAILAGVRVIGVVAGFAVSVLGARLLDLGEFGAAGVAITLGTVAALICNGGVNISAIYFSGRDPRRSQVLSTTTTIAIGGAILAAAIVMVAGLAVGGALGLTGRFDLFAVAALVAIGVIGFEYGGAVLLAVGRRRAFTLNELSRSLVALLATAALLAIWQRDLPFVAAAGIAYVAAAVAAFVVAARGAAPVAPGWDGEVARRSLAMGLRGQLSNVLQFINLRLDVLLMPAFLQLPAVGLYIVAVRVAEVLAQAAGAAGSLIFPAVSSQEDPGSTDLTGRAVRVSLVVVIVAAAIMIVVADPFLVVAFGSNYGPAATSLRILAVAMIPLSLMRVLAGDLKGRGRAGLVSWAMAGAVVATAVLDVILIPLLGIEGAALASLAAYSIGAALLVVAFRRVTGAPIQALVPAPADAASLVRSVLRG
jgi:stage V sporulation protein B